jgi:hypothetical protein
MVAIGAPPIDARLMSEFQKTMTDPGESRDEHAFRRRPA